MIILVIIEEKYFSEYSECGRYALTVPNVSDARVFDDLESASVVADNFGGEIVSYQT